MYICAVTVHLQDYCIYLDIFTKTNVGVLGLKYAKLNTFCILEDCLRIGVVALSNCIACFYASAANID